MLPSFCLPHVSTHVDVPDAGQLIILIDSEPVSSPIRVLTNVSRPFFNGLITLAGQKKKTSLGRFIIPIEHYLFETS